jgi:hypothetical protein
LPETSSSSSISNTEPKNFPTKPNGRSTVDDAHDVFNKKPNNVSPLNFVITSFGPTCGKCPKCNGQIVSKCQQLSKIKIVHTDTISWFMQGLLLNCYVCDFGFTSYNKDYADTLPQHIGIELNAKVAGNSNGIDMSLICMMRNGITPASIESTCRANLCIAYNNWKNCYEHHCKKKADLGMNCVMADCPLFP